MNKDLVENTHHQTFESLRQEEDGEQGGSEFWSARKLAKVLGYSEYRHFCLSLKKQKKHAKTAEMLLKTISWRPTKWSK